MIGDHFTDHYYGYIESKICISLCLLEAISSLFTTTTTGHGLLTLSSEIKNNPINVDPIKGQNYDYHTVLFIHSGQFSKLSNIFIK